MSKDKNYESLSTAVDLAALCAAAVAYPVTGVFFALCYFARDYLGSPLMKNEELDDDISLFGDLDDDL